MGKVNFVDEMNTFMRYAKNNQLTGRERLLWIALFTIANDRAIFNSQSREFDWPDGFIPIPNGELSLHSTLDKRGIEAVRNALKQKGMIDFRPGFKNKKPAEYRIFYLSTNIGYKTVPNDVPNNVPNYDPNSVPNHAPNNAPNSVSNHDANHTPNSEDFWYKNAPIILNNTERDIEKAKREAKESVTKAWASRRAECASGGFVDLDNRPQRINSGFVPLPWEEGDAL